MSGPHHCLYYDVALPPWRRYHLVLVDECQDLNAANLAFLKRCVVIPAGARGTVVCGVGDSFQSIYGFRGAASDALCRFTEAFHARHYRLTYCFRCPRRVVFLARHLEGRIRARDGAHTGSVEVRYTTDTLRTIQRVVERPLVGGAVVLCRHNQDILEVLADAFRNLDGDRYHWLSAATRSEMERVTLENASGTIGDLAVALGDSTTTRPPMDPTVKEIIELGKTLEPPDTPAADSRWIAYMRRALSAPGAGPARTTIATIHAVKGLQYPHVVLVNYNTIGQLKNTYYKNKICGTLPPPRDTLLEQERNLLYVAITRAMESLTFVLSAKHDGVISPFLDRDIVYSSTECDAD